MTEDRMAKIREATKKEVTKALTSIATLKERVAELEQENDELRREIEQLKESIKAYKLKWGSEPES